MLTPIQHKIKKGSTSKQVLVRFTNQISFVPQTSISEAQAGLVIKYQRMGLTYDSVSIPAVSLGSLSSSYNSGGIKHIGDGYYRLDIPDAALTDVGPLVDKVLITAAATGIVCSGALIELTNYDPATNTPKTTPEAY